MLGSTTFTGARASAPGAMASDPAAAHTAAMATGIRRRERGFCLLNGFLGVGGAPS